MRILVTGGAGYIGSVVNESLLEEGHEVIVFDNLSEGYRDAVDPRAKMVVGDLRDGETLRATLRSHKVEAVFQMAADAQVGESVINPRKYYDNNLRASLGLLDAMVDCDVRKLVFSSTCAIFGEPEKLPIDEQNPKAPTNPYGETKLAFERALRWYEPAYGIRSASLRYFNAAGATDKFGEAHRHESHLIPLVLQVAAGTREQITIYGDDYPTPDGTCVRDYIHVRDLAAAHVRVLSELNDRSVAYNLGCGGNGFSVQQVIDEVEK